MADQPPLWSDDDGLEPDADTDGPARMAAARAAAGADGPGLVRRDHPDTSRDAAQLVTPRTGTQRRRVLDYVAARGGATDREMQAALELDGNTQRPRRVELVTDGWLVDSGQRRLEHHRAAIVWTLATDPPTDPPASSSVPVHA